MILNEALWKLLFSHNTLRIWTWMDFLIDSRPLLALVGRTNRGDRRFNGASDGALQPSLERNYDLQSFFFIFFLEKQEANRISRGKNNRRRVTK